MLPYFSEVTEMMNLVVKLTVLTGMILTNHSTSLVKNMSSTMKDLSRYVDFNCRYGALIRDLASVFVCNFNRLNPFLTNVSMLFPQKKPKQTRRPLVFGVFRGYKTGTFARNGFSNDLLY